METTPEQFVNDFVEKKNEWEEWKWEDNFLRKLVCEFVFGSVNEENLEKAKTKYSLRFPGAKDSNAQNTNQGNEKNSETEDKNFFGLISPDQFSDQYSGLSFVMFPCNYKNKENEKHAKEEGHAYYSVTLNVGLSDYGDDMELAQRPGTRRTLLKVLHKYCKCDGFCAKRKDIEIEPASEAAGEQALYGYKQSFYDKQTTIGETCVTKDPRYRKTTLAYAVVDMNSPKGRFLMLQMLNWYAKLRAWKGLGEQNEMDNALKKYDEVFDIASKGDTTETEKKEVKELLKQRRFVVLQGAPGTGKTRLAKQIAEEQGKEQGTEEAQATEKAQVTEEAQVTVEISQRRGRGRPKKTAEYKTVYFTQFHAETSYADFVYGIVPDTNGASKGEVGLRFKEKEGIFIEAIRSARHYKNEGKNVYLIIDEINRANLSNVLGEAFYLFEPGLKDDDGTPGRKDDDGTPGRKDGKARIKLGKSDDPLELEGLPSNLYVIATMNTADRSLAVVDFALRRRFAWYTLKPHELDKDELEKEKKYFCTNEYMAMSEIFDTYASDEELNLKPGHAYFIVEKSTNEFVDSEMRDRLRYELMPLIKEYLTEGMLSDATEEFASYFRQYGVEEELFR